jgi:heme o synthase
MLEVCSSCLENYYLITYGAVLAATCVGTSMCAASANSFNQIFERNLDKKMKRTCNRPLPSGKLPVGEAVSFGVFAGTAGVATLFTLTNPVVAALGGANIFLYAGPYTFMKRYSEVNTWIGSVVGAIPPVMVGNFTPNISSFSALY